MVDALALAQDLIRRESVTPDPGDALAHLGGVLSGLGFTVEIVTLSEAGTEPVPNLYARLGSNAPNFCFAGHTDVVPVGDAGLWRDDPFAAVVRDGRLYGRGAADMKAAIAAFVAAVARVLDKGGIDALTGSLSFLITGDEEGPGINGTKKMLAWLKDKGEDIDLCLVGEPTNPQALGDMIKIGRRGSLHGVITAKGTAGHVAYPHLANNPIPGLLTLLHALTATPFDAGNAHFQPSNLEVLDLQVGNDADNVIPATAHARFNIRFNSEWTPDTLMAEIDGRLQATGVDHEINFRLSGDSFLTAPGALSDAVADAVEARLGRRPALSTTGGTSDARFIKDLCPVIEFGLIGETMHKVDENARLDDIEALVDIYEGVITRILGETA